MLVTSERIGWLVDQSKRERTKLALLTASSGLMKGWLATPREDDLFLASTSRGRQVGLGVLRVFRTDCLNHGILSVFVKPSMRRRGLGTMLIGMLRTRALNLWPEMTLAIRPPDPAAEAFFMKALR